MEKKLDLTKYKFDKPEMFLKTDQKLLEEAKLRSYYCANTKYNTMFSMMFYRGIKIEYKKDLDEAFLSSVMSYFQSFARSFEPKHEEKEAICAMLLSEIVESYEVCGEEK